MQVAAQFLDHPGASRGVPESFPSQQGQLRIRLMVQVQAVPEMKARNPGAT